jgi:hypothetical protein
MVLDGQVGVRIAGQPTGGEHVEEAVGLGGGMIDPSAGPDAPGERGVGHQRHERRLVPGLVRTP